QVHYDLFDLTRIGLHFIHPTRHQEGQLDVFADQPSKHLLHAGDDLVEVHDTGLKQLATAEGEELSREVRCALACPLDLLEIREHWVSLPQVRREKRRVTDDDGKEVVEVMRDPTCKIADGLHLLRLPELFLCLAESCLETFSLGEF